MRLALGAIATLSCFMLPQAYADSLDIAWLREGEVQAWRLNQTYAPAKPYAKLAQQNVPLGSLWKLFVFAYARDNGKKMPPYLCQRTAQQEQAEDVYCCEPGQQVSSDEALVRSCGPFFEPARLDIQSDEWRAYWIAKLPAEASWLADLQALTPATQVTVKSLLVALTVIPDNIREEAGAALLGVVLNGRGQGSVRYFGSRLRIKTYTWAHPSKADTKYGGGAGWLADGTPVWFGATGSSGQVLQRWSSAIGQALPALRSTNDSTCVVVDYFTRYPLKTVVDTSTGQAAQPGALNGTFRLLFTNNQSLTIRSAGELTLIRNSTNASSLKIVGRHALNEYVARVIEREGNVTEPEAAKALAIAARTYLMQNAEHEAGCLRISDSTRNQRVSPNPPSSTAMALAQWSDGLILQGAEVRYHYDTLQTGVLVWLEAVRQAQRGAFFDEILANAYPNAVLGTNAGQSECEPLAQAESWLKTQAPSWRHKLAGTAGFEPPQAFKVCRIRYGNPHSDQVRQRIFVHGLTTLNDQIALAHEYLHLAFSRHPSGTDERFIESKARYLVDAVYE